MQRSLRDRAWLAAAGGAQGLAIWTIVETWPGTQAAHAAALSALTLIAVAAVVFHFTWTPAARARALWLSFGVGAVYALVAAWIGWSLPVQDAAAHGDNERGATWFATSLVTLYVLGPFVQIYQRTGRTAFPYRDLFLNGWNNLFIAVVGALFVGAIWTVLLLSAALFNLIGIELFSDLLFEPVVVFALTGGASGFGIALGRESEQVLTTLRGVTLAVFRGLLLLVAFVALIFLFSLPFAGLDGLWSTNSASQLLLSLVALTVLFLNAVYQDGSSRQPLARAPQWMVHAALLAMPVYVAISIYGISLRIGQYGLTPPRFWGVLFAIVLGAYAVGYGLAVLRRGEPWLSLLRHVNRFVALLVVALGLLTHTPLLDPIAWSARSQFARLAEGRVEARDFDYGYLRFKLGREGSARLTELEALEGHAEIETIRDRAGRARTAQSYWQWQREHAPGIGPELFEVLPAGGALPEGLLEALLEDASELRLVFGPGACGEGGPCLAFRIDLDGEDPEEWILVVSQHHWSRLFAMAVTADGFASLGELQHGAGHISGSDLAQQLRALDFATSPARYRDLRIGETRYGLVSR